VAGIALIAVSAVCGYWAQASARDQALAHWRHEHRPGLAVWKHALESRGWREAATASPEFSRVYRSLPTVIEEAGQVWELPTAPCLAVYTGQGTAPLALFCQPTVAGAWPALRARGEPWEPLGQGWAAFEAALDRADQRPKPDAPVARTRAEYRDPRAIQY
jgi:hypothetical protein